jgi:crotonobetainyl-CoA:carnitine CoA-transferase CaiB-like acyl-CoA transferase
VKPPLSHDPARLHVLDLGRLLAGPVVATLLGDLGAEVIKVERPGIGDLQREVFPQAPGEPGMSYAWQVEGRNKRSITLEITHPQGKELLLRLVEWADVLVENFKPGSMARWGLAYEDLAAVNPRLVYVSVSGYGQTGPYRARPGLDFVGSGFAGLTFATGAPDRPPALPGYALTDYMAATFGALGALEAVRRRDAPGGTGRGEHVDVALYEPALRFSTPWLQYFQREAVLRVREGSSPRPDDSRPVVHWGYTYGTADGRWVSLLPIFISDESQRRLWQTIGRDDLIGDPRFATAEHRERNYKLLDAAVREWCAARDAAAIVAAFEAAKIPCGHVNSVADILADPHMQERSLREVDDHLGQPLVMPEVVPRLASGPGEIRWAGEDLGASNDEIYLDLLGLDPAEYKHLVTSGVI